MANSKVREVKVVLLGESGVGKSSIVLRFVTNNFKPYNESTIGASFMSKVLIYDNKQIKYQIWDTAGQEKYHSLAPMYYRGASAAILVFDITKMNSFETLQRWVEELRSNGPKDIIIAIAGNKADLEEQREVDSVMAESYAKQINASYTETSAKNDLQIQQVFIDISSRLPQSILSSPSTGARIRPPIMTDNKYSNGNSSSDSTSDTHTSGGFKLGNTQGSSTNNNNNATCC